MFKQDRPKGNGFAHLPAYVKAGIVAGAHRVPKRKVVSVSEPRRLSLSDGRVRLVIRHALSCGHGVRFECTIPVGALVACCRCEGGEAPVCLRATSAGSAQMSPTLVGLR